MKISAHHLFHFSVLIFTLLLSPLPFASCADAEKGVQITVSGIQRSVNGARTVPAGLFGTHAVPLNATRIAEWGIEADRKIDANPDGQPRENETPMLMECFFDRYQPALLLTDPHWKTRLENLATRYAKAAKDLDREPLVEFWNEPYLNWAVNPGINYDGGLYRQPPVAGEAMRTRIGGDLIEHLVWDAPRPVALRGFDPGKGHIDYLATRFMPSGLKAGDTFNWRDKPFVVEERWWGKDRSQPVSWWSGSVNRDFYHRMLEPFASSLKAINPDVTLVVGWGFHLNEGNWQAWHTLHQPLIDFAHPWIDGYNEHHYGGNTRMIAGTYETAYAYTLSAYGKKLKFYNTEAGGMLDPEQPGKFTPGVEGTPVEQARGAYTYMIRDVLHLIDTIPDKAATRFAHESHLHHGGDETAFKLLKPLRGQLMQTVVANDPNIWAVASMQDDLYTVVVFNDHYQTQQIGINITAPAGYALNSGSLAKGMDVPDKGMTLQEVPLPENNLSFHSIQLNGKDAVRFHFQLRKQSDAPIPTLQTRQFPAPQILQTVTPTAPAAFDISVPPATLSADSTVRLRFVHDSNLRWRPADMILSVNGETVPVAVTTDYIYELTLPRRLLQETNRILFSAPENAKPYLICTASLLLDTLEK